MLRLIVFLSHLVLRALGNPNDTVEYPPAANLIAPMITYQRILMNGGPTNPYPIAQLALAKPQMGMMELPMQKIMDGIRDGLQYLFQTQNEWTVPVPGTGHTGMETLLSNLVEPGDRVLIPVMGLWGERASEMARRFGGNVSNIREHAGSSFSIDEIEKAIILHQPNVVYMIHGESSTGVYQRVEGIGELCIKYNCLSVVDTVATIGAIPFHLDKWKIDAAFCNSQKGLAAPVGLAPVTFGPRAVEKIFSRKTDPIIFRLDLKVWKQYNYFGVDKTREMGWVTSYPVLLFYALREALALISIETLEKVWERHENGTNHLYERLSELPLDYYITDPADRLRGTIMLNPPKSITPIQIRDYVRTMTSIELGIGLGPTEGKNIRIALLGPNANIAHADLAVDSLKDALIHFGVMPNPATTTPAPIPIVTPVSIPPVLQPLVPPQQPVIV